MRIVNWFMAVICVILMAGCVTLPTGPSVRVFPAPGKPYDLFLSEDATCRQAAERQIGMLPQQISDENTARGAVVGTAIGAGVGAAIGAASGHAGPGAAIGAASGLLVGSSSGADAGRYEAREAQWRYDTAYLQCMYSHGNQVYNSGSRYYRRRAVIVPPSYQENEYPPPDYRPLYPPPDTPPPGPPPAPSVP
ncbi:MAG: YMGG-like glycine zipper-containing protein [Desulfuromonadaceae bacterium]